MNIPPIPNDAASMQSALIVVHSDLEQALRDLDREMKEVSSELEASVRSCELRLKQTNSAFTGLGDELSAEMESLAQKFLS